MLHNSTIRSKELIELTEKLGMSKKEVEGIIKDNPGDNNILISTGPDEYYISGYYGTISIKDF
jgi:hypothetical protein